MRSISLNRKPQIYQTYTMDQLISIPYVRYRQLNFASFIINLQYTDMQKLSQSLSFLKQFSPNLIQQNLSQNPIFIEYIQSFILQFYLLVNTQSIDDALIFINNVLDTSFRKQLVTNQLQSQIILFFDHFFVPSIKIFRKIFNPSQFNYLESNEFQLLIYNKIQQPHLQSQYCAIEFVNFYYDRITTELKTKLIDLIIANIKQFKDQFLTCSSLNFLLLYISQFEINLNSLAQSLTQQIDDFPLETLQIIEVHTQKQPQQLLFASLVTKLQQLLLQQKADIKKLTLQILINFTQNQIFQTLFTTPKDKIIQLLKINSKDINGLVLQFLRELIKNFDYYLEYDDYQLVLKTIDSGLRNKRKIVVVNGIELLLTICENDNEIFSLLQDLGIKDLSERIQLVYGDDSNINECVWLKFLE
ncbi:hypothetical protein SS50377_20955 [Spironucleus salmonicida]|uniref:Uncharacterized protein n=1 Tax=Spironucleus salmonicida TaxID=348837 RepID=A0A9P8M0C2_9EUKA|nr:hypothetical protein SS50377_20955 [Spironucleus salmonicida]